MIPATRLPAALAVLGSALAVNGAFGITWLFDGAERFSETAASWEFATFQRLHVLTLLLFVLLVPTLGALRGRNARGLSPVLLVGVTAALVLQTCTAFVMGFVAPYFAGISPAIMDREDGGSFAVAMSAVWIGFVVAMVALGVAVIRTRVLPLSTGVLLIVGGLATPMFGPIGSIALGAGLLRGAVARRRFADVRVGDAVAAA